MLDVIVINRQTDLDRLAFMTAQLDALGIRFYRLDAFTPQTLPEHDDDRYWDRWERPLSLDERACFMSHSVAWEWIADTGPALILEDDAVLARQVPDLLRNLGTTDEIEHLSLEVHGKPKLLARKSIPIAHGVSAHRMYMDRSGAAAYILRPSGARKLLTRAKVRPAIADKFIRQTTGLRSYQATPAMAVQLSMSDHFGLELGDIEVAPVLQRTKRFRSPPQAARWASAQLAQLGRRFQYFANTKPVKVPLKLEFFDY